MMQTRLPTLRLSRLSALPLAFALSSCGDSATPNKALIDDHQVLAGSVASATRGSGATLETYLQGTGDVLFTGALSGADAKANYRLSFELADGGSVVLVSHASATLGSGFRLAFTRTGDSITALASGPEGGVFFSGFPEAVTALLSATGTSDLFFEVHGDEQPLHFLIFSSTETSFTETNSLFNSEEDGSGWADTPANAFNGIGDRWGLSLTDATVLRAQLSAAKFSEE